MQDLFKNKYRISSNRMKNWNYANNGHYFITCVTAFRQELFGKIINGEMIMNDFGEIAYKEFFRSFEIREELFLGGFILMPNHWHAIIIMDKNNCSNPYPTIQKSQKQEEYFSIIRKPKSISSFVSSFKSSVVTQIDNYIDKTNLSFEKFNKHNPLWQSNYYEHIIRNDNEYHQIANYIKNNPQNWNNDSLNM